VGVRDCRIGLVRTIHHLQRKLVLHKLRIHHLVNIFTENFGLGRSAAIAAVGVIACAVFSAVFFFVRSAPPQSITIAGGPEGSAFWTNAYKYSARLVTNGIKVKVLTTHGSEENLDLVKRSGSEVIVGFVQGGLGLTNKPGDHDVVSLGSMFYEPLFLFHRGDLKLTLLSDLVGKRVGIGEPGSGSRALALELLATNGIVPGGVTTLVEKGGEEDVDALLKGTVDAVFLMSDSISSQSLRKLLRSQQVHLYSFVQANAYTRRFTYLKKLTIPEGSIDFGKDIPNADIQLVGPTAELIAPKNLHPALSDLLLDAASQVHSKATLLQQSGEFPAPLPSEFTLSEDAKRYYKTGKSWIYRKLPFWLAGLVAPVATAGISMALVLIPGLKLIPAVLRWRVKLILFRWYRALLAVERGLQGDVSPEKRRELMTRLDHIESTVEQIKVAASYADQFYGLRGHISFVRSGLNATASPTPKGQATK